MNPMLTVISTCLPSGCITGADASAGNAEAQDFESANDGRFRLREQTANQVTYPPGQAVVETAPAAVNIMAFHFWPRCEGNSP
jgi:hypothetical protein